MSGIYSDEFENNFNSRMSPANIKATAKKFLEFEKEHGATYKFGMFAKALLRERLTGQINTVRQRGLTTGKNTLEESQAN